MNKARSLAGLALGLACLSVIACKTPGAPRETGTPAAASGSGTAAASAASPRASAQPQGRAVSYSAAARSVARGGGGAPTVATSAQRGAVASRTAAGAGRKGNLFRAAPGEIDAVRVLLFGAAPVLFVGMVGAVSTGLDARQRRLAPGRT
jgi:hypothetical protein